MEYPNRLEVLIEQYENTLYRTALAILGNPAEAEDAVQDTFLRWLEKRPQFENEGHEKAWLLTVTANSCKSRLRQAKRRPTVELLDMNVMKECGRLLSHFLCDIDERWDEDLWS